MDKVTEWNCQRKGKGRLRATCHKSGNCFKSEGKGIRSKVSKKVGCIACVTTNPHKDTESPDVILQVERKFKIDLISKKNIFTLF